MALRRHPEVVGNFCVVAILLLLGFRSISRPSYVLGGCTLGTCGIGAWGYGPASDVHSGTERALHGRFSVMHARRAGICHAARCVK